MKPLRILEVAKEEQKNDLRHILHCLCNERKAKLLHDEIREGIRRIRQSPQQYGYVPGFSPKRWYGPTKTQKYRIVYQETETEIIIIAVFYSGLSDPHYWLDRGVR